MKHPISSQEKKCTFKICTMEGCRTVEAPLVSDHSEDKLDMLTTRPEQVKTERVLEQKECECDPRPGHHICHANGKYVDMNDCPHCSISKEGDWEKEFVRKYRNLHPLIDWSKAAPVSIPEGILIDFISKQIQLSLQEERERTARGLLSMLDCKSTPTFCSAHQTHDIKEYLYKLIS